MPQASRKNTKQEDKDAQRALEKESKRNRGAMSCAECRRLKLKCDKTVPCSSCKRRGCSAICPNGSLITGQGTRFVLADTEKLHSKIAEMSDRIRVLEDALSLHEAKHPLLAREFLTIKSVIDLHAAIDASRAAGLSSTPEANEGEEEQEGDQQAYVNAFGTLAIRDDGASTFYGPSAGSESLLAGEVTESTPSPQAEPPQHYAMRPDYLPAGKAISHMSGAFPQAPSAVFDGMDVDELAYETLPPWPRAAQLTDLYLAQAPWFFGAVTRRQLLEELLPAWYPEARKSSSPNPLPGTSTPSSSNGEARGPHELALLFVVFCFGAMTDEALPAAPANEEADKYHVYARAALGLGPVLDGPPSVATVQTLAMLAIYQGMCAGEHSIESTWSTFGLATKLAQSIGLHRDCARWMLTPAEVQKRRALFWELFITDGWQSLATGRLATFYLPYVDCELPADPDSKLDEEGTPVLSFPAWKARFGHRCVAAVIEQSQTAKVPKYSTIVELDRRIRDMPLPKYSEDRPPEGANLSETMEHFMPHNYRHLTLLYVHRCFFAEALSNNPSDPMRSPYAPSFLAGYKSACELLGNLRYAFKRFPAQMARFWVLWTHCFSSSVMLASIITHATGAGTKSKMTSAALTELRRAVDLFEEGAKYGGRAVKFLPILKRLLQKAEQAYSNVAPQATPDIFTPSVPGPKPKDELSIFSGQTHTVNTKAPPIASKIARTSSATLSMTSTSSPTATASSTTQISGDSAPTAGGPAPLTGVPVLPQPPLEGVLAQQARDTVNLHPNLVAQWNGLEGHLNAQLYDAQRDSYDDEDTYMTPATASFPHPLLLPAQPAESSGAPVSEPRYPQYEQKQEQHRTVPQIQVQAPPPIEVPQLQAHEAQMEQGTSPVYSQQANYAYRDAYRPPQQQQEPPRDTKPYRDEHERHQQQQQKQQREEEARQREREQEEWHRQREQQEAYERHAQQQRERQQQYTYQSFAAPKHQPAQQHHHQHQQYPSDRTEYHQTYVAPGTGGPQYDDGAGYQQHQHQQEYDQRYSQHYSVQQQQQPTQEQYWQQQQAYDAQGYAYPPQTSIGYPLQSGEFPAYQHDQHIQERWQSLGHYIGSPQRPT
ncbi:hypothetical protein CONPUDRAFT_144866 [Coniophora puteana RWD-64-598 SS2]|uniref:Zn(2)-C6 fungal-type domain-containing protein n=1 Tax=Coniophora puteana (strain RWD-64-598) TaxID=741705 RepID=A0A5M3MKA1_CONPW|nr:uncharacterized protein CONPUDRAFT_144866 [Coniophora puteana RWD-64-598 SS2]EIW79658.1 hypothetical protein CONPUDRAFT_144866 [Coniophora puteana RWD-64-598 SS2]